LGKARLCTKELKKERTMLNNKAYQKPSTLNPCTKWASSKMMQALITNKKSPRVKMVAGNVSKISNGFITASSTANTNATNIAVTILLFSIATPGRMAANINTLTVVMRILYKKFIVLHLSLKDNRIVYKSCIVSSNIL
jgi:hypothetical protein